MQADEPLTAKYSQSDEGVYLSDMPESSFPLPRRVSGECVSHGDVEILKCS